VPEIEQLRAEGVISRQGLARALTAKGVTAPRAGQIHTMVARVLARAGALSMSHMAYRCPDGRCSM
jgi:hypothetical protein